MLKVSRRLNYGVQLMIALGNFKGNGTIPTKEMAEKLNIPLPFLHQIAHTLMQSGLIKATPGPKGGLRIGKNVEKITLLDIFESLEGQLTLPSMMEDEDEELTKEAKVTGELWEKVGVQVCSGLKSVNLVDLLDK